MAIDQEEIDDTDADTQINSDEEEETEGAGDKGKDGKGKPAGDADDDSDEDEESEDSDDDESDEDDEDSKPATIGDIKKIFAIRAKNRSAAVARTSGKRDLPNAVRGPSKEAQRLDQVEKTQREILSLENKRQFGYQNNLPPDEVDVVYRLVRKPRAKDLLDPVVKGALDGYRSSKRAKANVPSSNGKPNHVPGRDTKDEKNLTPQDKRERLINRRQEILESQRNGRR